MSIVRNSGADHQLASLWEDRYGKQAAVPSTNFNYQPIGELLGRCSVRRFLDRPLAEGMMDVLLACAQSAPSKSDLQQYSVIVVEDEEKRASIAALLPSMPWIADAAEVLIFCGDLHRNRTLADHHNLPNDNDNVDSFMNAAVDAALAMQSFISAAERLGLGCCPISMIRNHIDEVTALFALPDGVFPVAGLACGWPSESGRVSQRLPASVVVHRDQYCSESVVESVLAHDAHRREREPIAVRKQRHVDRYGARDDMGWSENISRQLSVPERPGFREYLKRRNINLS